MILSVADEDRSAKKDNDRENTRNDVRGLLRHRTFGVLVMTSLSCGPHTIGKSIDEKILVIPEIRKEQRDIKSMPRCSRLFHRLKLQLQRELDDTRGLSGLHDGLRRRWSYRGTAGRSEDA